MQSRFVPFNLSQFSDLMKSIGFAQVSPKAFPGTFEAVFERQIANKKGETLPCSVRVYSSVDIRTNETRELGNDAIRLLIIREDGAPILSAESRVYRTKNAFDKTVESARELFKIAFNSQCSVCKENDRFGLMVERNGKNGKFKGCSNYGQGCCKHTEQIPA